MTPAQFFIAETPEELVGHELPAGGVCVSLSENDTHHAVRVLRLTEGSEVRIALNDSGRAFTGTIEMTESSSTDSVLAVRLNHEITGSSTPPPVHSLILGLCKGKKNELVVEKATELGVSEVLVWQTARSISRIKGESDQLTKTGKLSNVAVAASKQSKRRSVPKVIIAQSSDELYPLLNQSEPRLRLACSLSENATPISEIDFPSPASIDIAVGPEGDFTPEEEEWLQENGFQLVSLGENILRSETAAIVAIAMAQALALKR